MKSVELFPLIGQKVEVTTKQEKTVKAKLLWVYPSWCEQSESLKLDTGETFFLTDLTKVSVSE